MCMVKKARSKDLSKLWKKTDERADEIHEAFGEDAGEYFRKIRTKLDLQELIEIELNAYAKSVAKSIAEQIYTSQKVKA